MAGLPPWLWIVFGVVVIIAAAVRSFYRRWRGMCRRVREEFAEFVRQHHPGAEVTGEQLGNLVVRLPDGGERVWEMADVYAAVARLPGMGADPAARQQLYRQAAAACFSPAPPAPLPPVVSTPLSAPTHGPWIKPRLVRPESLAGAAPHAVPLQLPVLDLGLTVVYLLDLPQGGRTLTEQDRGELELELAELHALALENLRKDFPREIVEQALSGESGSGIQFGDGFDTARLLLVPECLQEGEELVAMTAPHDLLLLLPASVRDDPEKMNEGLRLLKECDHPVLLDRPVLVNRAGFELL